MAPSTCLKTGQSIVCGICASDAVENLLTISRDFYKNQAIRNSNNIRLMNKKDVNFYVFSNITVLTSYFINFTSMFNF